MYRLGRVRDVLGLGHIAHHRQDLGTGLLTQGVRSRLQLVRGACRNGHARATLGHHAGRGQPQACTAPGDEHASVLKILLHQ